VSHPRVPRLRNVQENNGTRCRSKPCKANSSEPLQVVFLQLLVERRHRDAERSSDVGLVAGSVAEGLRIAARSIRASEWPPSASSSSPGESSATSPTASSRRRWCGRGRGQRGWDSPAPRPDPAVCGVLRRGRDRARDVCTPDASARRGNVSRAQSTDCELSITLPRLNGFLNLRQSIRRRAKVSSPVCARPRPTGCAS
jgi:hypothetical protein